MVLCAVLLGVNLLVACGNQSSTSKSSSSSSQAQTSSQKALSVKLLHGKYEQCAGLISVPVIMKNAGTNSTLIDSNNFTLTINNKKYHPYQLGGEPADFHMNFNSSNIYQNTVTFDIHTHLINSDLKNIKLTYLNDQGKEVLAKPVSKNVNQNEIRPNITGVNPTDLGSYYKKAADYLKSNAKTKRENPKATLPTLEQQFQDSKYDQLRLWVAITGTGSQGGQNAVMKVLNDTKTDFIMHYGDIELVDKDSNEYQVNPAYRNYSVYLPHGKYTTLVVPFESQLTAAEKPYHVEVRQDQDGNNPEGSFMSTKNTFNPAETIFSKEVTANTLFSVSPDKYPKGSIRWTNPQINQANNTITAVVKLQDYFNLDNRLTNYQLVSSNDGGQKVVSSIRKVSPAFVDTTDSTKITWHVHGLSKALAYQHVALQSNGKTILQLK